MKPVHAQAATVVFSLQQNAQIEPLARSIHTLRRQRGGAMKILVQENTASLRATDERLLLACGANMVYPMECPLSRCLTMIESVQGQKFGSLCAGRYHYLAVNDPAAQTAWFPEVGCVL